MARVRKILAAASLRLLALLLFVVGVILMADGVILVCFFLLTQRSDTAKGVGLASTMVAAGVVLVFAWSGVRRVLDRVEGRGGIAAGFDVTAVGSRSVLPAEGDDAASAQARP